MTKTGWKGIVCAASALSLFFASTILHPIIVSAQEPIKIGGLFDLTGPTSEVGKDYAAGAQSAVEWINENGGINGRPIELISVDYGYKPPQAVAAYKKFVTQDRVVLIQGWGTGDTEAMRPFVARDEMVYMSASYSSHLDDPSSAPYNFFVGTSYSDQMRIFLQWVKETWTEASRPPRVAFIYADNPYGRAPIQAGRDYAKEIGVEVVDEEVVPTKFQDSTSQLLNMKKYEPDYAYINTTVSWVAVILKDAHKLGLKTKFVMNNWGFDENLPEVAKEAAEGAYGMAPFAFFGDDVPGMKTILEVHQAKHPDDKHIVRHVQAWVSILIMAEALRMAGDDLSGPNIKKQLENLREFDTGGLTAPITFAPDDHRPNVKCRIYQVQNGKVVPATDYLEVPKKKEYLGY